ncbi:MAG TPA: hypothetical protein VM097_11290 [Mycobacteriales bacterium]|nr:hypothetical protein [Mycobacteriales bacterium]
MMRTRLLVTAGLLATSCLALTVHAAPPGPLADGPMGAAADVAWMQDLETKMNDNLHGGKAVPVSFGTAEQVPGDVVGTGAWGDSGLWTGVYLGGEALRYATAKAHLKRLVPGWDGKGKAEDAPGHVGVVVDEEQVAFWTAQRDQALARVRTIQAAEHVDITIAEDWNGTLKVPPGVNPGGLPEPVGAGEKHLADFGGGVIRGEKGMIMRACTPTTLPLGIREGNRVYKITWEHGDKQAYYCESSPSRDTYAGLTFGLLTTYDMVDDEALRTQIRADLLAMGEFLIKYGWTYPRPHGYVSADHPFDGFYSPDLFLQVPAARLNLTNAVRHVLADGDDPVAKAKWDGIWAEELATQGPALALSLQIDSHNPNDGYYPLNLHHLTAFNLLRTLTGAERAVVAQAVSVMDTTTRDDMNAHFEAIMFSQTGDADRLSDAVRDLRAWQQYRVTSSTTHVDNRPRCNQGLACVPKDQYTFTTPAGDVAWKPGSSTELRAARPLPVAMRPPTDFLWQRVPTKLEEPQQAATHREPGIDYLTPYWVLRYYTEVEHPAQGPLPTWVGPASN